MSPLDFNLFPKLEEAKRGRRFSSLEKLSTDGTRAIRYLNKRGVLDGIIIIVFERKICVIAGTRTTDLQFSVLAP